MTDKFFSALQLLVVFFPLLLPTIDEIVWGVGESAETEILSLAALTNRRPGSKCPAQIFFENKEVAGHEVLVVGEGEGQDGRS